jgi:hypothetical protein
MAEQADQPIEADCIAADRAFTNDEAAAEAEQGNEDDAPPYLYYTEFPDDVDYEENSAMAAESILDELIWFPIEFVAQATTQEEAWQSESGMTIPLYRQASKAIVPCRLFDDHALMRLSADDDLAVWSYRYQMLVEHSVTTCSAV